MRIANKSVRSSHMTSHTKIACLLMLGLLPLASGNKAFAVDATTQPPAMPAVVAPLPIASPVPPPLAQQEPVKAPGADLEKTIAGMEDKTSESAKNALKHLDGTSDPMTFEDLNAARQTVARIDALIEVERRMSELQKVRSERTVGSNSFANAIPASALTPPSTPQLPTPLSMPASLASAMPAGMPAPRIEEIKPHNNWSNIEISRISGTDGKYTATLRLADGDLHPAKVGDELAGGGTVRWISASAVGIEEKGETHTLHIKNVDMVYSAIR